MSKPHKALLDEQEVDTSAYERGYDQGQRWGVLLGFIICLLLFGAALLL